MPLDLAIAFAALFLTAVLAGIVVRGLLAASRRGRGDDDVMAMAARVGDTRMPEFIAARMRRRRAAEIRKRASRKSPQTKRWKSARRTGS